MDFIEKGTDPVLQLASMLVRLCNVIGDHRSFECPLAAI